MKLGEVPAVVVVNVGVVAVVVDVGVAVVVGDVVVADVEDVEGK